MESTLERNDSDERTVETRATLVLIDDQVAFSEALGLAISLTPDLQVIGRAPEVESGVELVLALEPDCAVFDYRLPGPLSGVDGARQLRDAGYRRPVLILTGYPAPQVHREAAAIDSTIGVFSKNSAVSEIVTAFRDAVSRPSASCEKTHADAGANPAGLSSGELAVLELISNGRSAAEIADHLILSVHTVRSRIKAILKKLESNSQIEAVAKATRLGMIVPPG